MILPTMAIRKSSGIRTAHLSTQLSISTPPQKVFAFFASALD